MGLWLVFADNFVENQTAQFSLHNDQREGTAYAIGNTRRDPNTGDQRSGNGAVWTKEVRLLRRSRASESQLVPLPAFRIACQTGMNVRI